MNSISGQSDFEFACNKLAEILEIQIDVHPDFFYRNVFRNGFGNK